MHVLFGGVLSLMCRAIIIEEVSLFLCIQVNDEQTEKQRSADMTTKRKRKVRRNVGAGSASSSAAGQSARLEIHLSAAEQQLMDHMQRRVDCEPILGSAVTDFPAFFRQLGSADRTS